MNRKLMRGMIVNEMEVPMKRCLILAGVLFAGLAASANNTNYWTNATGDGKWSTVGNWSTGVLPEQQDYVSICSPVNGDILDIDVEGGVTIGAFISTNLPVRVTGEKLTIIGGWRGSGWGGQNRAGTTDNWSWQSSYPVTLDCEVCFNPAHTTEVRMMDISRSASVYFLKPVTVRFNSGSYRRFSLCPCRDTSSFYFLSTLDVDGGNGNIVFSPEKGDGGVHCYGSVTAAKLDMTEWNGGRFHLYAPDNAIPNFSIAYSGYAIPACPDAFPTNLVLAVPGANAWSSASVNESNGINLDNFDQTVDRLTSSYKSSWSGVATQNQGNIFSSDMHHLVSGAPVYRAPAELTLRATTNGNALVAIHDRVSVTWDPIGDFRQIFSNCTSKTSGDLTVKRGEMSVRGSASLANVHAIDVAAGATFDLDTNADGSFAGLDRVTVGAGGTFRITERVSNPFSGGYAVFQLAEGAKIDTVAAVTIPVIEYAGSFVADGVYTADGADGSMAAPWLTGLGRVTVASSNVAVWTKAADGDWSETENWLGGRLPTATMKKVVFPCAGDDYTVTLSTETALPKRVDIWNAGGGVATLKVSAHVTHAGGFLSLDPGGRLELAAGGCYDYSGSGTSYQAESSTPFRIVGGELLSSGGYMCISNATGGVAIGGKRGSTGRIRMTSGRFLYHTTSAQHAVILGAGGEIALSGDAHFRCGTVDSSSSYKTVPVYANEGGTLTAKNTAKFDLSLSSYNWHMLQARGKRIFSDSSSYVQRGGDYGRFDFGTLGTNRAEIVFRDHAMMKTESGTSSIGGLLRYESDALSTSNGYEMAVGCVSGAKGEMYVGSGQVGVMSRGFFVGGATANNQASPRDTVGLFCLTGGTFRVNGDNSKSWGGNNPNGVLVGYGARTSVRAGRPFIGTMAISAGTFQQNAGGLVIGAGYGKGEFILTGGRYSYGGQMPIDVGICGGLGRMAVSGGIFEATWSWSGKAADLYVGGAPLSAVQPDGADFVAAGYPAFRHDADGVLTVSGGTLSIKGRTYVGADGDGVLEMVGTAGTFTTGSLVLSNAVAGAETATARQTSSLVRFTLGADGVSPVKATNLVIADGAKLEVDWTGYEGKKSRVKLFDVAPAKVTGAFLPENVIAVGAPVDMTVNVYSDGVYARLLKGLAIIVR